MHPRGATHDVRAMVLGRSLALSAIQRRSRRR
jgi:hypothetical protein